MKICISIFMLIFFSGISAEDDPPRLKSRVYFEKGISEKDISGWEKEFFKDHHTEIADEISNLNSV